MKGRTGPSVPVHGATLNRRELLSAGGVLVVSLALPAHGQQALPVGMQLDPSLLESWLEIHADNTILYRTGKCDFGQSTIYTAYPQIIADELGVRFDAITTVVSGDTDRTPDGGGTFGLLRENALNLRKVAAYTREAILDLASRKLAVPRSALAIADGTIIGQGRSASFGEIVAGERLELTIPVSGSLTSFAGLVVEGSPPFRSPSEYRAIGRSIGNPSLKPKLTGQDPFATDIKLPGMVHARVVLPETLGSVLIAPGTLDKAAFPGASMVRIGNLLAVISPDEWEAIGAAQALAATTQWTDWKGLPGHDRLPEILASDTDWAQIPVSSGNANRAGPSGSAAKVHEASYYTPYWKHAPIGPSIALADVRPDGTVTVHTHSQNPQFLRKSIALMLDIPPSQVTIRTYPGSGHYGRSNGGNSGAEDQAVLISRATGRPVRLQWMRPDDLRWSTQSSATIAKLRIGLDEGGRMKSYQADHHQPPMQDDRLLGAILAGLPTIGTPALDNPEPIHRAPNRVVDRWLYGAVPHVREQAHACWQIGESTSPTGIGLRGHSMRTPVQQPQNTAREAALSEAAALARKDALQFRIDHSDDPRVRDVLERLRTESAWDTRPSPSPRARARGKVPTRGRGVSVLWRGGTYWACAAHVSLTPATGELKVERITVVIDPGIAVNPLQLRRQNEAGCLMGVSQTLHEELTFDAGGVLAADWSGYPILTMAEMPEVKVVIAGKIDADSYGQGSEGANALAAPAIMAAVFDATGKAPRRLPLKPEYLKALMRN